MRRSFFYTALGLVALSLGFTACEPRALTEKDIFATEQQVTDLLEAEPKGYRVYDINDFVAAFMTEKGNFMSDSSVYRTRSKYGSFYLFSIDTIPTDTIGIYLRGRISTDDYGGNFYKSLVLQQVVNNKQQNLRLSVDIGSLGGLCHIGQEILIRCNGLAIGRYADQPQLCVPSYNNNIHALRPDEKVGWAPGRIPGERFRRATTLIGLPDVTKLQIDTIEIHEFLSITKEAEMREMDGRLVCIRNVYFTGEYENNGSLAPCSTQDPDKYTSSTNTANVFAPTTNNIGYPPSRIISDLGGNKCLVGNSEYCKFAYFYLPGMDTTKVANTENQADATRCPLFVGSVTGILGQYHDNGSSEHDAYDWSITPRDLSFEGHPAVVNDLQFWAKSAVTVGPDSYNPGDAWIPREYGFYSLK